VVIYDRLAPEALLDLAPSSAERIYAGKKPGNPTLDQDAINEAIVSRARAGKSVVRLKGGDPFVFGRGGEEALACVHAGVEFEVIPGVTSAVAAPAAAGIPLTHRGLSSSVAFVTASVGANAEPDWQRVATSADTLVVLMAAGRLETTCAALIAAGRSADEPAAIIQWATTSAQRSETGTLSDIAQRAEEAGIGAPATLVVGAVAALAEELAGGDAQEPRAERSS
jgi:uroporphyrinogen III methyltransferase/synthase